MYQHDLTESILDEKLRLTCIDAVAEVGVDVNTGSQEILEKVPSLTAKLCNKIIDARPIRSRHQLLKVSGLGDKTFVNCAGFVRVAGGNEPLDNTMVHPESYGLARWLLKKLEWTLTDANSNGIIQQHQDKWEAIAGKASDKFDVPSERALAVISHLYTSITSLDPRLRSTLESKAAPSSIGSTAGCSSLPMNASTIEALRETKLPLRGIVATIRNVVDFGAFVDIGLEADGLIHISKMGDVALNSLLVGQEVGVDILGVSETGKISVGLAGLNLAADNRDSKRKTKSFDVKKPAAKRQRKAK